MSFIDPRKLAAEYFHRAYETQLRGDFEEAIALYSQSIEAYPTAEAYTFRGWTYSFLGDYEQAKQECFRAIEVDPDLGNPYNDIGAYLIEQERYEEAVPWLEKALAAPRYDAYCYPWFNLGRIYERKRQWMMAKQCYAKAHQENPRYKVALSAFKRLSSMWN